MDIGAWEINDWHKQRGFTPYMGTIYCGYNYVVRRNGEIENPRPDDVAGVHCAGHNSSSIGIVWVGKKLMSNPQRESLVELCKKLLKDYQLDVSDVYPHNEFNKGKSCPNIDIEELREEIKT
jgi:hypothetical protein